MHMGSPILEQGRLYGLARERKGQFFCLDARTGRIIWSSPGRQGEYASIVSAGEFLLALKDSADLLVFRKSDAQFEPVAQYEVADRPTWAHPVILENGVLIKDSQSLSLWRF